MKCEKYVKPFRASDCLNKSYLKLPNVPQPSMLPNFVCMLQQMPFEIVDYPTVFYVRQYIVIVADPSTLVDPSGSCPVCHGWLSSIFVGLAKCILVKKFKQHCLFSLAVILFHSLEREFPKQRGVRPRYDRHNFGR